jgi:hypothetical protein
MTMTIQPIKKSNRGGARANSGRKLLTHEQRASKAEAKRQVLLDELLFPAISSAMHAEPGYWKDEYLTFELSKVQIKEAYGAEGLKEWCSHFTMKKIGHKDRNGLGHKTTWTLNLNMYGFIVKLVESLGHSIKDIPKVGFPPQAMIDRLEAIRLKAEKRKL